jgi:hypothetical protein
VERWPGPTLARVGARLAALVFLVTCLLPPALTSPLAHAAGCLGDEQILLAPAEPRVGSSLMVVAVSHYAHDDVLLLGPDGPLGVTPYTNGDRHVWQATVIPDHAGEYLYAFGVASDDARLVTCADVRTVVTDGAASASEPVAADGGTAASDVPSGQTSALVAILNPYGRDAMTSNDPDARTGLQAAPAAAAPADAAPAAGDPATPTRTPRPTRTPVRHSSTSNGNDNDDDNSNENDNTADPTQTPTPTRVPTDTRTPTLTGVPTDTRTPTPTRTPRPDPTDTRVPTDTPLPTATRTPRPDPSDTPTRAPTATRTPRPDPTDTPSPTPTPTFAPPSIADWSPGSAVCGQSLTIRGERFGNDRDAVHGRVTIDGVTATVNAWGESQIEVRVPLTAKPGNDRELLIVVAEQTARTNRLRVSC